MALPPTVSLGMLAGCLICPTTGTIAEEKDMRALTTKHGGKFSTSLDPRAATHLIVVRKVGSRKQEVYSACV